MASRALSAARGLSPNPSPVAVARMAVLEAFLGLATPSPPSHEDLARLKAAQVALYSTLSSSNCQPSCMSADVPEEVLESQIISGTRSFMALSFSDREPLLEAYFMFHEAVALYYEGKQRPHLACVVLAAVLAGDEPSLHSPLHRGLVVELQGRLAGMALDLLNVVESRGHVSRAASLLSEGERAWGDQRTWFLFERTLSLRLQLEIVTARHVIMCEGVASREELQRLTTAAAALASASSGLHPLVGRTQIWMGEVLLADFDPEDSHQWLRGAQLCQKARDYFVTSCPYRCAEGAASVVALAGSLSDESGRLAVPNVVMTHLMRSSLSTAVAVFSALSRQNKVWALLPALSIADTEEGQASEGAGTGGGGGGGGSGGEGKGELYDEVARWAEPFVLILRCSRSRPLQSKMEGVLEEALKAFKAVAGALGSLAVLYLGTGLSALALKTVGMVDPHLAGSFVVSVIEWSLREAFGRPPSAVVDVEGVTADVERVVGAAALLTLGRAVYLQGGSSLNLVCDRACACWMRALALASSVSLVPATHGQGEEKAEEGRGEAMKKETSGGGEEPSVRVNVPRLPSLMDLLQVVREWDMSAPDCRLATAALTHIVRARLQRACHLENEKSEGAEGEVREEHEEDEEEEGQDTDGCGGESSELVAAALLAVLCRKKVRESGDGKGTRSTLEGLVLLAEAQVRARLCAQAAANARAIWSTLRKAGNEAMEVEFRGRVWRLALAARDFDAVRAWAEHAASSSHEVTRLQGRSYLGLVECRQATLVTRSSRAHYRGLKMLVAAVRQAQHTPEFPCGSLGELLEDAARECGVAGRPDDAVDLNSAALDVWNQGHELSPEALATRQIRFAASVLAAKAPSNRALSLAESHLSRAVAALKGQSSSGDRSQLLGRAYIKLAQLHSCRSGIDSLEAALYFRLARTSLDRSDPDVVSLVRKHPEESCETP